MTRPLLVYDGSEPAFRRVMGALTRGSDIRAVQWESASVQAFLRAQFGDHPFAFLLIEGDRVHAGSETVARVLERRGVGGRLPALLQRAYPPTAAPLGRLIHGREPAALDGTFPLDERAAAHLEPLREPVDVPVREAD
jgi:hypothetical protein